MKLADLFWEKNMETSPTWATQLGDDRYNDQLGDNSPQAEEARRVWLQDMLTKVEDIDPKTLSTADRVTRNALHFELRSDLARMDCGFGDWNINPMGGPQVWLFNIPSYQKLTDGKSGKDLLGRWEKMGAYIRQHQKNIMRGAKAGNFATEVAVRKVIEQLDELEKQSVEDWALMKPAHETPSAWTGEERASFARSLRGIITQEVRPALMDFRDYLKAEILPNARSQEKPGISHLAGGLECYQNMVLVHTSLDISPEAIHKIGLQEVEKINAETRALGKKVLGTDDLEKIHTMLRDDKDLHFETRDEVQAKAEEALERARQVMPEWFGVLPKAPCNVVRIEPHEEKHSTIAYYRRPAADGSRPGSYYINTYAPETRPRYEAEALAFHEAIPGHHLQIAIAQELEDIPTFRKHSGVTAFVEGWALYTERLSNEMGLYSSDIDRLGMLSYDSWRACRLVVDTGLHALGWSRQEAIDFMIANSSLAPNNIANEVDRYIAWPGQALAYKLGQREIFRLRAMAKEKLGGAFDIKEFHDVVLSQGAVDLATLDAMVGDYVEEKLK
ncbi:MAG: DUF885 domain-containing protein [Candidatus Eisenbacteria bacterium]|uniref:DUF885 domain-containing protein n=1 Tax=Eiseniibacteriota bacterium TaxID=2212470 RepID=A0A7Y2ECB3_UNCEI|nr:DUF885 domain-containing protein [Candidatus Eisenbacteria bacterium]